MNRGSAISGGLNRLERISWNFTRYVHDLDDPSSLADNEVTSLLQDYLGTLWVGTKEAGLHQYDPLMDAFSRVSYTEDFRRSVLWSFQATDRYQFNVSVIFEDSRNNLWIGEYGRGIFTKTAALDDFDGHRYDPTSLVSISSDDVYSMYEDRSGVLWIGTNAGLSKIDLFEKRFRQIRHEPGNPNSPPQRKRPGHRVCWPSLQPARAQPVCLHARRARPRLARCGQSAPGRLHRPQSWLVHIPRKGCQQRRGLERDCFVADSDSSAVVEDGMGI